MSRWRELQQINHSYKDREHYTWQALNHIQADGLYKQLQDLAEKEQWQSVLSTWKSITKLVPNYPDPAELSIKASQQLKTSYTNNNVSRSVRSVSRVTQKGNDFNWPEDNSPGTDDFPYLDDGGLSLKQLFILITVILFFVFVVANCTSY